jgi:hypothetical protein
MSKALDQAIDHLLTNLKNVSEGDYGELINLGSLLNAESIEEFMSPEADTPDEGPVVTDETKISVLGRYYHMQSPGTVVLYKYNIKKFFDTLLLEVIRRAPFMTRADLAAAARLVASKTYHHELFHFDCNVLRLMFGTEQDKLKEEALAVAWSRMRIAEERKAWQSQIGRMNGVVYGVLMDLAYQFKSPGYCDWPNYADEVRFKTGVLDYINPHKADFLMSSGVPVQEILFSMFGKGKDGQGFVEICV